MEMIITTKRRHAQQTLRGMCFLGCGRLFLLMRLCPGRMHRGDSGRVRSMMLYPRNFLEPVDSLPSYPGAVARKSQIFLVRFLLMLWQISEYRYEETLEIRTQLCIAFPGGETTTTEPFRWWQKQLWGHTGCRALLKQSPGRESCPLKGWSCFLGRQSPRASRRFHRRDVFPLFLEL